VLREEITVAREVYRHAKRFGHVACGPQSIRPAQHHQQFNLLDRLDTAVQKCAKLGRNGSGAAEPIQAIGSSGIELFH
jgi:hypothetical protein